MKLVDDLNYIINNSKINNFIPKNITKTDIDINNIIEKYSKLSKIDKVNFCNQISLDIAWNLLGFSIRMATYSLRLIDIKYFINGLLVLQIILKIIDTREILIILSLYYDVSQKNEFSFNQILELNDEFSLLLSNFIARPEEYKTLESMGYILLKDDNYEYYYRKI